MPLLGSFQLLLGMPEFAINRQPQADTSYSGSFRNGNGENISELALSAGDNTRAYLVLTGTPSEEFSNSVLGTVTVTIGG